MFLLDLLVEEDGVVFPERELRQILADAEMHERLFYELLTIVMKVCGRASRQHTIPGIQRELRDIEHWIHEHYIELRQTMPKDLKQLYLKEIAFPIHEQR